MNTHVKTALSTKQLHSLLQPDLSVLELARLVHTLALEMTGSELAFVSEIDRATGTLVSHTHVDAFASMPNLADHDRRMEFAPNRQGFYPALLGHALNTGKAFYTNDASSHPASTGVPSGHVPIRSFLSVPALDEGRAIGLIGLANPRSPYTDDDLEKAELLAELFATGLRRAWHHDNLRVSHLALESLSIGVITTNAGGDILSVNDAFCQLTGRDESGLVGQNCRILQSENSDRAEAARMAESLSNRLPYHGEQLLARRDGSTFWSSLSIVRVQATGGEVLVGVFEDITARRAAERGRRELETLFQQSQKLESLGQLAGGIAHDVNNVLTAIATVTNRQLLVVSAEDPSRRALETIERAVERGGALTSGLLNFARKKPGLTKSVRWNDVIAEHVELLRYTTLAQVAFDVDLDPTLAVIEGEAESLGHVLMNLCLNGIDAMKANQRPPILRVTSRQRGHEVAIEVVDNGSGMTPEVRSRALEPFFTTKPRNVGTGLGLALAQRVVEAHGGRLELESEVGLGTTVRLFFPGSRYRLPVEELPAAEPSAPFRRVLVVDDDDLVRENLVELLETLGLEVEEASDGEAALARADRREFDLVLLDMNMPGLSGAATLGRLRLRWPELPVLICTGLADQAVLDLLATTPHTRLLRKPFVLAQLRELLNV